MFKRDASLVLDWYLRVTDRARKGRTFVMATTAEERRSVSFPSGSELCDAWLYLPAGAGASRPLPVVVMAHGLGGVKQAGLAPFAERFRDAGYACLVFDYRYFGDSTGEPRELVDISSQLADWRAAVSFARSLPEIDADRVIVWGTSFGGGHAIVTAAEDRRIAAVIAQCPFTDGPASVSAIDLRTSAKLTLRALLDVVAGLVGIAPVRVRTAGEPGTVALMTAADALEGYSALLRASGLPSIPDVPARIAMRILFYRPGRRAKDLVCPSLFCVCERDSVAPAWATLAHAARAPKAEIKRHPEGHFGIYLGAPFERNVSDQVAFMRTHVPSGRTEPV